MGPLLSDTARSWQERGEGACLRKALRSLAARAMVALHDAGPTTMLIGPLKLKAQIYCGAEIAMGPGKADLLEAIAREGSISRAGKALGMSYRRTWLLVDAMNRCWAERLVETTPGGSAQRGARLTDCGTRVLRLYRAIEHAIEQAAVGGALVELEALLRAAPLPPHQSEAGPA